MPPSGASASEGGDSGANARLDAVVTAGKKRKASPTPPRKMPVCEDESFSDDSDE
jgi:hypothetical protein